MAAYTKLNLVRDVQDMAPKFGMSPGLESRFARSALGLEKSGLTLFKVAPGYRFPFGHRHAEQEEVYLVVTGSARMRLEDDLVELGPWDAVRVPPETMRGFEGGPEGCEMLIFGAPNVQGDIEMDRGWWEPDG